MDISGGMPDVIIKMLANSLPGKVQLLPAVPEQWPQGTIEGILCRSFQCAPFVFLRFNWGSS